MQVLSQEAAGDSVPSSAAESPVDRSQRRIENAQALVAEASEAASAGASTQTLQGQVLLCLAAVVLAVGRREQLMASLSQVALPDMAAAVLAVAALIRLAPSRAKMGIAHLSALLQSVFLLGSVAHDISEVKRDIKQLRDDMRGLSDRAAWVPPRRRPRRGSRISEPQAPPPAAL